MLTEEQRDRAAGLAYEISMAAERLGEAQTIWNNMKAVLPIGLLNGNERETLVDAFHNKLLSLRERRTSAITALSIYLQDIK